MPRFEKVSFAGAAGRALAGRLELPATARRAPRAVRALLHLLEGQPTPRRGSRSAWRDRGIAMLRFDVAGIGGSAAISPTRISPRMSRTAAAACVPAHARNGAKLLVGHSLGGAAVLAAAGRVPEAVAIATIAAPAIRRTYPPIRQFARAIRSTAREVSIAGRAHIRQSFVEDLGTQNWRRGRGVAPAR